MRGLLFAASVGLASCASTVPAKGDTDAADTDTVGTDACGDGVLDAGESCDLGDLNAEDGNCRPDCSCAPDQVWVLSFADVSDRVAFDGRGVADADAPAGDGAWGTSATDLDGDGTIKFELYGTPSVDNLSCFADITIADLASVGFSTRKPTLLGADADFYATLYTEPDGVDDEALFYGRRLTSQNFQSRSLDAPDDVWNRWSSEVGANQLTWADSAVTGTLFGATLPTLSELQSSTAFDWSTVVDGSPSTPIAYGAERLKYVSLQTGSGRATSEFTGLLDAIEVRFTDGRSLSIDLEE